MPTTALRSFQSQPKAHRKQKDGKERCENSRRFGWRLIYAPTKVLRLSGNDHLCARWLDDDVRNLRPKRTHSATYGIARQRFFGSISFGMFRVAVISVRVGLFSRALDPVFVVASSIGGWFGVNPISALERFPE